MSVLFFLYLSFKSVSNVKFPCFPSGSESDRAHTSNHEYTACFLCGTFLRIRVLIALISVKNSTKNHTLNIIKNQDLLVEEFSLFRMSKQ